MPDLPSSNRPTPRFKLAALSLVGAAMVALPLAQVLRYQHAELQAALTAQAGLDPVARAVAVQRGLLAHQGVAGQVLSGQEALESERRRRQRAVDERVAALAAALVVASDRTNDEFVALRDDWTLLAREVQQRAVSAPESDLAHRLLVEQTLQIIDFVDIAAGLGRGGDSGAAQWAAVTTRSLPRVVAEIAALASTGATVAGRYDERRVAAAEATLAHALARLDAARERDTVPRPALAEALAAAAAAADRHFRVLRQESARPTPSGEAALQAQFRLLEATHAVTAEALAGHIDSVRRDRNALLAATAALALLATGLLARLALPSATHPGRRRTDPRRPGDTAEGSRLTATAARPDDGPDEARRLLQRLRRHHGAQRPRPHPRDAPAETLPPEDA